MSISSVAKKDKEASSEFASFGLLRPLLSPPPAESISLALVMDQQLKLSQVYHLISGHDDCYQKQVD